MRHLAAFGPASVRDMQTWSGLTRLRKVTERLRPGLRGFRDEHGGGLLDLPDAPRPDPDTPAPPCFLPEYDNLLLSHADRSRVIGDERLKIIIENRLTLGTVLVDGFVRALWRLTRHRGAATLRIEPFEPLPAAERRRGRRATPWPPSDAVAAEGARLLAFTAPGAASHDLQFAPALPPGS